jgi:hypothetical protein
MSTAYSQYVPQHERPVITALITELLERGYKIAVHDGEEYVTPKSRKMATIRPALGGSGEDSLVVFDGDTGKRLGYWWLIYSNGSEHDPMIVISDYGWSDDATGETFETIWNTLSKRYG